MKLYVGAIVCLAAADSAAEGIKAILRQNGASCAPAIVTNVWQPGRDTMEGPVMVNATAFPDCSSDHAVVSSVRIFDSEQEARGSLDHTFGWIARA